MWSIHTLYMCLSTWLYIYSVYPLYFYFYSAWKPWKITNTQSSAADKDVTNIDDIAEDATKPEDREYLTKNKGSYQYFQPFSLA